MFSDQKNLVRYLQNGNEKAFAYLVQEYHQLLSVFAFSLTRNQAKAEDIVQNVFLKVWEKRSNLDASYSLKSYLHTLTYNEFVDQIRKRKAVTKLEEKYAEALNNFIEKKDWEEINTAITLVKSEIENLPPKCKKVFKLSKEEGLTNTEISEYLNISVKAVEAQITKALSQLRKKFANDTKTLLFLQFYS